MAATLDEIENVIAVLLCGRQRRLRDVAEMGEMPRGRAQAALNALVAEGVVRLIPTDAALRSVGMPNRYVLLQERCCYCGKDGSETDEFVFNQNWEWECAACSDANP